MIERHGPEETAVSKDEDVPGKPWNFYCECGTISHHRTEKAADRARSKHVNDVNLHIEQVRRTAGGVELAVQALYHRLDENDEAKRLLALCQANQPKKRGKRA